MKVKNWCDVVSSKRYQDVKATLRARIESGLHAPGSKIPATSELIREFGVSSITIRRALRDLEAEGLLYGHQGLGVFVSNHPRINRSLNPPYMKSIGDQMQLVGIRPGIRELSSSLRVPDAAVLATLSLPAETLVYTHEKVVLADDRPIGYDVTYLPRAIGERLRSDLGCDFIMPILEKNKIAYRSVQYRIEACALAHREVAALGAAVGSPLLSIKYSPIDLDGEPILLGHMVTRAEWFSYDFRVEHPGQRSKGSSQESIFEHQL